MRDFIHSILLFTSLNFISYDCLAINVPQDEENNTITITFKETNKDFEEWGPQLVKVQKKHEQYGDFLYTQFSNSPLRKKFIGTHRDITSLFGKVSVKFPTSIGVCKGLLIGPRHVLIDKDHLISEDGSWAQSITFTPATPPTKEERDAKACFSFCTKRVNNIGDKLGMIILDKAIGIKVGWVDLLASTTAQDTEFPEYSNDVKWVMDFQLRAMCEEPFFFEMSVYYERLFEKKGFQTSLLSVSTLNRFVKWMQSYQFFPVSAVPYYRENEGLGTITLCFKKNKETELITDSPALVYESVSSSSKEPIISFIYYEKANDDPYCKKMKVAIISTYHEGGLEKIMNLFLGDKPTYQKYTRWRLPEIRIGRCYEATCNVDSSRHNIFDSFKMVQSGLEAAGLQGGKRCNNSIELKALVEKDTNLRPGRLF